MVSVVKRREGIQAMAGQMRSPGRPSTARREDRLRIWEAIARGVSSEDARPQRLGCRLRVGRGGSGRRVGCRRSLWVRSQAVSVVWGTGRDRDSACAGCGVAGGRPPAGPFGVDYLPGVAAERVHGSRGVVDRATTAQWHAERRASRPNVSKLAANDELRRYVQDRLCQHGRSSGQVAVRDGGLITAGKRLGAPSRSPRHLRIDSPNEVCAYLSRGDLPGSLGVGLRRAAAGVGGSLRTGRALRVPRVRTRPQGPQVRHARDHDQRTTGRGRRPGSAGTQGR